MTEEEQEEFWGQAERRWATDRQARAAYRTQRNSAKRRGIPFLFTFAEWWDWWQVDNRWDRRGMGKDALVMARIGDTGPYSTENVYCATHAQNAGDKHATEDARQAAARDAKEKWARGFDFRIAKGSRHVRSIPIDTPAGRFANATEAAEHFGITRQGVRYRIKAGIEGWSYAREP
jgi:hypothetical protein